MTNPQNVLICGITFNIFAKIELLFHSTKYFIIFGYFFFKLCLRNFSPANFPLSRTFTFARLFLLRSRGLPTTSERVAFGATSWWRSGGSHYRFCGTTTFHFRTAFYARLLPPLRHHAVASKINRQLCYRFSFITFHRSF